MGRIELSEIRIVLVWILKHAEQTSTVKIFWESAGDDEKYWPTGSSFKANWCSKFPDFNS